MGYNRQIKETRKKAWFAWKKIKQLCSNYKGLKMSTIIQLVKISVLPILFYCAPVWLEGRENKFHDLWYDILKVATGAQCKTAENKLEVLCQLPPLDIQVKLIIIKFLIKNFLSHNPDLLSTEIEDRMLQPHPKDIVSQHGVILKEYLAHKWGVRSSHNVDLLQAQYSGIIYTKPNIKAFQDHLWKQRIKQWDVDNKYPVSYTHLTLPTKA